MTRVSRCRTQVPAGPTGLTGSMAIRSQLCSGLPVYVQRNGLARTQLKYSMNFNVRSRRSSREMSGDPCTLLGEAGTGTYGGADADDDSGVLRFVRRLQSRPGSAMKPG